jgi:hypothetical protein
MKLKFIPWLLVVVSVVMVVLLYSANQRQETELAQLRPASQELEQLRASIADTNQAQAQAQSAELERLRADNADLLRLRNEVRQLREQNQQLTRQVQSAQTQAQAAQAQAEQFRNTAVQASAQAQQAQAAAQTQNQTLACISNLRQIDAAKQQWAQQNNRPAGTPVTPADVARFLRGGVLPTCPAGGIYLINVVGLPPTCSSPGHVAPKAQ